MLGYQALPSYKIMKNYQLISLAGPGRAFDLGKVEIEFSIVSYRRAEGSVSYHQCFLLDQKILFLSEVMEFFNLENLGMKVITVQYCMQ